MCKIMHLYTIATVTVHICTITITCVFNILHFFSLSITLSTSHSHLSLVLSLPQSTDQFPDHRYPTYNDHRKSSELSGTTKLKVRKKRKEKRYSNALVDSLDCDNRTFACLGGTFLNNYT